MMDLLIFTTFFIASGAGIYSFMTGKAITDLWGLALGGGMSIGGYIVDVYTNFSYVITAGLSMEGWGFTLLTAGIVIFTMVMLMNFLTTRNRTLVR